MRTVPMDLVESFGNWGKEGKRLLVFVWNSGGKERSKSQEIETHFLVAKKE